MKFRILNLDKKLELITTFSILFLVYLFLFLRIPWNLVLSPTTISGGDTGSHNYLVYYLKEIFPKIKWWSGDWYAGFPFLYFYPPLLYVLTIFLSYFLPLNIAFKLITLLGSFLFPISIFLALKILKSEFPIPLLGSVLAIGYLFLEQFSMYGGNLPSTLAGEFSYSFSFSLFFIFWALIVKDISSSDFRFKILPVIVLFLMVLSHPFPVIVSVLSSVFLVISKIKWLIQKEKRKDFSFLCFYLIRIFLVGFLLTAFWSLPFVALLGYTSKMEWTRLIQIKDLFPPSLVIFEIMGVLGLILAFLKNRKKEEKIICFLYPLIAGLIFYFTLNHSSIWNTRFLPFILVIFLIFATFCLKELMHFLSASFLKGQSFKERKIKIFLVIFTSLFSINYLFIFLPKTISYLHFWFKWNYEGFENKIGYQKLQALMKALQELPHGRVMWEYRNEYDNIFGTPRVLENTPIWSKKPTFEGLLIESAISGYFHFINQAETTKTPSSAISGIKYPPFNFQKGIEHLKIFGADYFVAYTPDIKELSDKNLEKIKEVNDFNIYRIKTDLVELVKSFEIQRKTKDWIDESINWYQTKDLSEKIIFLSEKEEKDFKENLNQDLVTLKDNKGRVKDFLYSIEILEKNKDSLVFKTNALGVPHLIKISYFLGWQVKGGKGPYLISPSFIMVVPFNEKVELTYNYNLYDKIGFILSLFTLIFLAFQKPFHSLKLLLRNPLKPKG